MEHVTQRGSTPDSWNIDFMIDFTRTIVYYQNGYIHRHDLIYVPFLILIGVVGTFIGRLILHRIPQEKFKRLALVFILLIGLITVLKLIVI